MFLVMDLKFFLTSSFLGVGLAMDASAVSMANGLKDPKMKINKVLLIAFMFAFFQALMPLIGYLVGHAVLELIEPFIPWIALLLLSFVGGKMLYEGMKNKSDEEVKSLTFQALIIQAIATSIDALSVGFTFAGYEIIEALVACGLIALVTFSICILSVFIGQRFGDKLGNKAEILGGIILIAIGLEIFITGIFF